MPYRFSPISTAKLYFTEVSVSAGERFFEALQQAHAGHGTEKLAEVMHDRFQWTSITKTSMASQVHSKAEALEFFNITRNVTEEIVFADDDVLIFTGVGELGAWLTYCKFEGGKAVDMRHARGQSPE